MDLLKRFYDKVILGILMLCLIVVMTLQSCDLQKTRGKVKDADDEMSSRFSQKTVEKVDRSNFKVDIHKRESDLLRPRLTPDAYGSLLTPEDYVYSIDGARWLLHFDTQRSPFTRRLDVASGSHVDPEDEPGTTPGPINNEIDSDDDGIPDAVEEQYGLDPQDEADAYLDLDADGFRNLEEFRAGTKLDLSQSHPPLISRVRLMGTPKVQLLPFQLVKVIPQPPDDKRSWEIQVNVFSRGRRKSQFYKLGRVIEPYQYKIIDVAYKQVTEKRGGVRVKVGASEIIVQRENESPITVPQDRRVPEKDPLYELGVLYGERPSRIKVTGSDPFELVGLGGTRETYHIVAAGPKGLKVEDTEGREFQVPNYQDRDLKRFFGKPERRQPSGQGPGGGPDGMPPGALPKPADFLQQNNPY